MGQLNVRIPDTLQHKLELRAEQEQISIDRYILYVLTSHLAHDYLLIPVSEQARGEQQRDYDRLLEKHPNPTDEALEEALLAREPAEPEKDLTPEMIALVKAKINAANTKQSAMR